MPKSTATRTSVERQLRSYNRIRRAVPESIGILAEGDSWFSTPVASWQKPTLIARLKTHKRNGKRQFAIVSVANPGADLVDMITRNNIDLVFATNNLPSNRNYEVVLLSCGGNDVLGEELEELLIDASPGTPARQCLNAAGNDMEKAARCVLDCTAFKRLVHVRLANRLKEFRKRVLKGLGLGKARVLLHGYDYPIPDGRPLNFLGFKFGPWLLPAFENHNIPKKYHASVVKLLIDEFNAMLKEVALSQQRFHYLDLRGLLTEKRDWADEIHPHSDTGMIKLRRELVEALHAVRDGTAGSVIGGGRISEEFRC